MFVLCEQATDGPRYTGRTMGKIKTKLTDFLPSLRLGPMVPLNRLSPVWPVSPPRLRSRLQNSGPFFEPFKNTGPGEGGMRENLESGFL